MNKDQELEALHILQEEAAEVIQIVSKIFRFGYNSYHPNDPDKISNIDNLEQEIADFIVLVDVLNSYGIVSWERISEKKMNKLSQLAKYSHL